MPLQFLSFGLVIFGKDSPVICKPNGFDNFNSSTYCKNFSGFVPKFLSISFAIAKLIDRKSTRLNSSHQIISYAVFCLKKKRTKPEKFLSISFAIAKLI